MDADEAERPPLRGLALLCSMPPSGNTGTAGRIMKATPLLGARLTWYSFCSRCEMPGRWPGLDRPFEFARLTPYNGPSMVDFARINPWHSNVKYAQRAKCQGSPGLAFGHAVTRE